MCKEYRYQMYTLTRSFNGKYGTYPSRGYYIDFNSDRVANSEKIKRLQAENWIDEDTRGVQILWTINSAWSQTIYTF
jgi:hypothetical protein